MSDQNRLSRELASRSSTERSKTWTPPSLLPEPVPEPGYSYRYVRTSLLNTPDAMNVSSKLREGWEPVAVESQPQMQVNLDPRSATSGNIETGGLMLCKMPTEMVDQRNAYYEAQNKAQVESVDNHFMRQNDPRMPLFNERRSAVSFGRGSK